MDFNPSPSTHIIVDSSQANGLHNSISSSKWKERWRTLFLAYRTLGVVFGGLVTSPLYVYPSMKLRSPTEEDYLSIYSIIFWTLSLIGVVKYVGIAVNADDQGEENETNHPTELYSGIYKVDLAGKSCVGFGSLSVALRNWFQNNKTSFLLELKQGRLAACLCNFL